MINYYSELPHNNIVIKSCYEFGGAQAGVSEQSFDLTTLGDDGGAGGDGLDERPLGDGFSTLGKDAVAP